MIRISVVGMGMAFEPHARALSERTDRVQVRWATSRSSDRLDAARRLGFPVTSDVAAAIADPEVDAVFLLTPPDTHHSLGSLAISRGKHLLVEKPLDARLDQARDLVRMADEADVRLGVVLQHRFRRSSIRFAELLRARSLGAIQFATVSVPWWRTQAYYDQPGRGDLARDGGGVLMTQALHTLDVFRAALGPVEVIAARAATTALHTMETEDLVCALLSLPGGAPATLMATTAFPPGCTERIEVVGELGAAVLQGEALQVRWIDGREERCGEALETGSGVAAMGFSHVPHGALIDDFCKAIVERRPPVASGDEALATQEFIDRLLQTAGAVHRLK